MAPRKEDEDTNLMMVSDLPSPSSPPSHVPSPLAKSLSFEVLDLSFPMDDMDLSRLALTSSFKRIYDRATALSGRVDDSLEVCNKSVILDACRGSIRSDLSTMLDEARLLLENMGTGGGCLLTMITPWRVSLAQLRVMSYLHAIEGALDCPSRDTLERKLQVAWESIMSHFHSVSEAETKDCDTELAFRISPWTMPNLAFDLTVGQPALHMLKPDNAHLSTQHLPINVGVWAIVELLATDIAEDDQTVAKSHPACLVQIESCVHEAHKYGTGAGIVGDASLRVKLSPIEHLLDENLKRWGFENDAESAMQVKEARCVQVNAFPPKPRANVDLFTSSAYGDNAIGISLCFQTFKTLKDEAPEVKIELVVG